MINAADLSFPPQNLYSTKPPITGETCISDRARFVAHPNSFARAVCSWTTNLSYGQLAAHSGILTDKTRTDEV